MEKSIKLLEAILFAITSRPFKIDSRTDEMGVLLTLDVHRDDMGRVIGREGSTAKAIRTLLRVVGMQDNARVNLKINEPEGSARSSAMSDAEMLNT